MRTPRVPGIQRHHVHTAACEGMRLENVYHGTHVLVVHNVVSVNEDVVEGRSDPYHDWNVELAGHLHHPELLFRGTQSHSEDVGPRSKHLVP